MKRNILICLIFNALSFNLAYAQTFNNPQIDLCVLQDIIGKKGIVGYRQVLYRSSSNILLTTETDGDGRIFCDSSITFPLDYIQKCLINNDLDSLNLKLKGKHKYKKLKKNKDLAIFVYFLSFSFNNEEFVGEIEVVGNVLIEVILNRVYYSGDRKLLEREVYLQPTTLMIDNVIHQGRHQEMIQSALFDFPKTKILKNK